MDKFSPPRQLSSKFHNSWDYTHLTKVLHILNELIKGDDNERAKKCKDAIDRFMINSRRK